MSFRSNLFQSKTLMSFAFLILIFPSNSLSAGLIIQKFSIPRPSRNGPNAGNRMMMYFDDASRKSKYTIPWNPPPDSGHYKSQKNGNIPETNDLKKKYSEEKLQQINKMLTFYDANSAALLSPDQVGNEMNYWSKRSGLVGEPGKMYESIIELNICNSTTAIGCMAGFWRSTFNVIKENTDSYNNWISGRQERNQVFMTVYPNCQEMYDHEIMSTLVKAINFCQLSCTYFGKKFSFTHFHPNFKNEPKLLSPTRHSPFPCAGLHFPGKDDDTFQSPEIKTQSNRGYISDKDRLIRSNLEDIFNSAAFSANSVGTKHADAESSNSSILLEDDLVISKTKTWIGSYNQMQDNSDEQSKLRMKTNAALKYSDTIENRWRATNSTMAEEVYAEIWETISDLYDLCIEREKVVTTEQVSDKQFGEINEGQEFLSVMFLSPNFFTFNAQGFKSFAITVNAALKHLTNGKIFIEVFHPEYIGGRGYRHSLRRSPYPSIQICCKLENSNSK